MTAWIVSTCVLVLVCLALRQVFRGRVDPRLTYGLWLLAALRILIPFSPIPSALSVDALVEQSGIEERVAQARYTPRVVSTYGSNSGNRSPAEYIASMENADWFQQSFQETYGSVTPVQILSAQEATPEEVKELGGTEGQSYMRMEVLTIRDRLAWLRWLWGGGAAVTAATLLAVNLRFHRRLKRCRKLYEGDLRLPASIPVYVAPFLPSPCLFGLWRPAIYLNGAALESGRLNHILIHELTHHRHRDHLWAAARSLCLVVQWFNPLVWLAAHLSRQDCELACDTSAIRALGEEQRLSYGKTLVDMVAQGRTPGQLLYTATTMTAGKNGLRERVTLIARGHRMTGLTLAAVVLISAVAAGCTFASAPAAQSDAPALEFAEQFDSYNDPQAGRHFRISQDMLDGQPCYLFRNEEHGAAIRAVRREESNDWLARLQLDSGEELNFEMPVFPLGNGNVSGAADFSLADLTGDGVPELVYIYGAGGTGFWNDQAQVFDLASMATIPVSWDNEALAGYVAIQPVARSVEDDGTLVYEVRSSDGQSRLCSAPAEGEAVADGGIPDGAEAVFGHYETLRLEEGGLTLYTAFATEHTPPGISVGGLTAPLVYDSDTNTLTPGSYTLSAHAPVGDFPDDLIPEDDPEAVWTSVRVDGSVTDHEQVATLFARQVAANYRALPSWSRMANEDVQVRSTSVYDAYYGEEENFCAELSFYVKVANEVTAGEWQAGAGLAVKGDGQFADHWLWGMQALFRRDENGDWMCTDWGTGGYFVRIPVYTDYASCQELAAAFPLTSGDTHDWRIPLIMSYRAEEVPDDFLAALEGMSDTDRAELLYRMGYAAILDRAGYLALRDLLPEEWRDKLAVEVFERDGLTLAVHGVREVRTETIMDHGVTPHEYPVFVLDPGASAYVWEAGLSDPAYAADGQAHPQYAYILAPLDERERITEALTLRELTPDVQGVAHLEASLYVLRFDTNL